MSLIKIAKLKDDAVYARAFAKAFKKVEDKEDYLNLLAANQYAKKVSDRYNKYAKFKKNKNLKMIGAIGLGTAAKAGGIIAYKKYHKKNKEK